MHEILCVALVLPCAAGTWWLSRHVHPGLLILVGLGVSAVGSGLRHNGGGGPFFMALEVLGAVVVVHGLFLWGRRSATRQ